MPRTVLTSASPTAPCGYAPASPRLGSTSSIGRFDRLFRAFACPALCKIDVQGAERIVIEGMGDRIADFDLVIIGTDLIATLQSSTPEFADIVSAMKKRGFVLYDTISITRRPLDWAMAQVDAVLVPEMSPLRSGRRWPN